MRILTVTHYQPPHRGGIETVAEALVERYRRSGHEAMWVSSDLPVATPAVGQVRIRAWNVLEDAFGVPYPLWSMQAAGLMRQWVDWADIVHCHDCLYMGTVLAVRRARRVGKPVLLTQHVAPVPYRSRALRAVQQLAYATIGRRVHAQVDQVVFISRVVQQWFEQRMTYRRPPLFVANGVDTSVFHFADEVTRRAARARLQLPPDRQIILFVGRFVDKKGMPAVEGLARRYPRSWFVLIGEGPIDPRTWKLDNVALQPFQSQAVLRDYYWASDVLLLPSTGEGFPLVVMEAMTCGTPAIISSDTFAAWNDGREFFLATEPNAASIAALLDKQPSLLSPAARQAVSTYARGRWNWNDVANEYLELLGGLCAQDAAAADQAPRMPARTL